MTYSDTIQRAFRDWNERRAYLDNGGNYRVRRSGGPSGPIAPWNKEVKRLFADCGEFHLAAQQQATTTQTSGEEG